MDDKKNNEPKNHSTSSLLIEAGISLFIVGIIIIWIANSCGF